MPEGDTIYHTAVVLRKALLGAAGHCIPQRRRIEQSRQQVEQNRSRLCRRHSGSRIRWIFHRLLWLKRTGIVKPSIN